MIRTIGSGRCLVLPATIHCQRPKTKSLAIYYKHLADKLSFPFTAKYSVETASLQLKTFPITVLGLLDLDDFANNDGYGLFCQARSRQAAYPAATNRSRSWQGQSESAVGCRLFVLVCKLASLIVRKRSQQMARIRTTATLKNPKPNAPRPTHPVTSCLMLPCSSTTIS